MRPKTLPQSRSRRSVLRGAAVATTAGAGLAITRPQELSAAIDDGPSMRRDRPVPSRSGLPSLPPASVIAHNRMGFGPALGDLAAFDALGPDDASRMAAYVAQQLDPDSIDDTTLEQRFTASNLVTVGLSANPTVLLQTLWDWYINNNAPNGETSSSIPRDELTRATWMRAVYSKKQLLEVMVDFWMNHFNVYGNHSSFVRATLPHMELVIRQGAFGNFRTLLEQVTKSTAMLYYLDNYTSSNAGPNENHSRELFELHTLGAENYLGILQQNQVQVDGNGFPVGYVDADVFEATRCFTGWSFSYGVGDDGDTGLFHYRAEWHDRFQKTVLAQFIPQDQPALQDGLTVLDRLAAHPGTGRYIARKLCRRLLGDFPPQNVIDAAAAVFTAQWQAPDQLKQVLETILLSPEFLTTWGEKVKRPYEIAASALRATGANFTLRMDDSDTSSFLWRYDDTGQELFNWPAPNGYPDVRGAWQRMTPRVMSWRLCNWLIDFYNDNTQTYYLNVLGQTPAHVRTANELADFWIDRLLGRPMAAEDREQIVQFMAQGINPDFDLNWTDEDTLDRVRAMVGLILMSPDFLWR